MDVQDTGILSSPVAFISETVYTSVVEIWFHGKPSLWPKQPGISAAPPRLDRPPSEAVNKDEVYQRLR
jgi:hypothetical protein